MVPGMYDVYLGTVATAAAALIGLLFVAVSVRDDTIFGPDAVPGGEALAITAFIGLVNSFVVSLLGLIPKTNIGEPAVVMAVLSVVWTVRLYRRLHAGRNAVVLGVTLVAYAAQMGCGVLLISRPHDSGQVINLCFLIFATLIVSLQRAWSLLKGRHLAGPGAVAGNRGSPPGPARDASRLPPVLPLVQLGCSWRARSSPAPVGPMALSARLDMAVFLRRPGGRGHRRLWAFTRTGRGCDVHPEATARRVTGSSGQLPAELR
jgi:hypothetical protein